MALVNHAKREINSKIVYFGAGLSGKAANLNYIFKKLKPSHRGTFKVMNVQSDRMLFFDFMPFSKKSMKGYDLRFHVYTISGDSPDASSWKMMLKGVDGIVFVADSTPHRSEANRQNFRDLQEFLAAVRPAGDVPVVVQCNKVDLPSALSPEEVRTILGTGKVSVVPAAASKGEGVLETLSQIVKMVQDKLLQEGFELEKEDGYSGASAAVEDGGGVTSAPVGLPEIAPATAEIPAEPALVADETPLPVPVLSGPEVRLAGDCEVIDGHVLIPLLIRCGETEKRFSITVSLREEGKT